MMADGDSHSAADRRAAEAEGTQLYDLRPTGDRRSGDVFDPLGKFDELGCCSRRWVPFDPASLGPRIGRVMVPDIAEQQARGCPMDDQANVVVDTN
jgi:hypothetical protein